MSAPSQQYTSIARLLHWSVAGLIVLQYVLARLAENAEHADRTVRVLALLANHKSVGITVLMLAVIRLSWRFFRAPPALPVQMAGWQINASRISHGLLYFLLFSLPITGWLMSSATAYSVSWFGLFQLPDLVAPDPLLSDRLEQVHDTLAKLLFVVAVVHIVAAFKHAIVDRDGVMSRMTSTPVVILFLALIGGGVYQLGLPDSPRAAPVQTAPAASVETPEISTPFEKEEAPADDTMEESPEAAEQLAAAPEPLPTWQIDYTNSYIRFTGDQAGASFSGEWTSWEASIQFDAEALDRSAFAVTVNTSGVDTNDADRDATIIDPDWFDTANHPQAFYNASRFSAEADGSFVADGELTIKGAASPVKLAFTVTGEDGKQVITGQGRLLEGNALLDRLALGLGLGDWQDTSWVGQEVTVEVRVEATLP